LDIAKGGLKFSRETQSQTQKGRSKGPWINNLLTKIEMCRIGAYYQFMGYMYIENADKAKYGTLLSGLQTQISLGNNQNPHTLLEANNVLSNFKTDNQVRQKYSNSKKETSENGEVLQVSVAQMDGKCFCCGKSGHKSPACKYKDKSMSEWAVNKSKNKQQSHLNTDSRQEARSGDAQSQTSRATSTATGTIPG
jgi:hypothetical protein